MSIARILLSRIRACFKGNRLYILHGGILLKPIIKLPKEILKPKKTLIKPAEAILKFRKALNKPKKEKIA